MGQSSHEAPTIPLLTSARDVHLLSPEDAARKLPVRLRAIVTFTIDTQKTFLQDETDAIFLSRNRTGPPLYPGQIVELEGMTGPGVFAPEVVERKLKIIGEGPLPEPRQVAFDQLASGSEDCKWAEVRGVIVRVQEEPKRDYFQITLAMDGGQLRAYIYGIPKTNLAQLVDSTVLLRGVVGGTFNRNRQILAPLFCAQGPKNFVILEPSSADPFEAPLRSVRNLFQFISAESYSRRAKVRAVVTDQRRGEYLFVRDGVNGLFVQTQDKTPLIPGDVVEVVGFPVMGLYTPRLEDAIYRKVGSGPAPVPVVTTPKELLKGSYDSDLVTVRAQLIESAYRDGQRVMVLEADNVIFNAHIDHPRNARFPGGFENQSELELTGICRVQELVGMTRGMFAPRVFRLNLRSPADIVLVRSPGWWTPQRLLWAVAVMAILIVAAILWIWSLRRKVRQQTQIIGSTIEQQAVTEERTRIAREFHDTLEQELAGLSIQLDAVGMCVTNSAGKDLLVASRKLIQRIQGDARQVIMDLRSRHAEERPLSAALSEAAERICPGSSIRCHVSVVGESRKLAARTEHNLLRLGQEAMFNAVKHSGCNSIQIDLVYERERFCLSIADDGKGFDPAAARNLPGHFGLMGMRERAKKLGASFAVESAPGKGTKITISVPAILKGQGTHEVTLLADSNEVDHAPDKPSRKEMIDTLRH